MNGKTKVAIAAAGVAAGFAAQALIRRKKERVIKGDVVLITGGSRGLGLAMARQFTKEGSRVAICARNAAELNLVHRELNCFTVECDVTSKSAVERMIADVIRRFGRIDVLVNNAGEIQVGPVEDIGIEDFESAMNVMFWGTVYPTMALLPDFLKSKRGQIVNITSIGGKVGVPHLLPYTTAKYAATGFSEGLRAELNGSGVLITTIAPGLMRTGSYNAAKFKGNQAAESNWFSLGASLPGLSQDADRAAKQIVSAVKHGDSEKILSVPANLLARLNALAPGITQDLLGLAGRLLLPEASSKAGSKKAKPGWSLPNLNSRKMRALLFLGRMAAKKFNQRTA